MTYPGRVIKEGETDDVLLRRIVEQLAERLNLTGDEIDDIRREDDFGPRLTQYVKEFQVGNVDNHGHPLLQDGKIGALTWAALFDQAPPASVVQGAPLASRAVSIAALELAKKVREIPRNSNKGPEVEEYLRSVGLGPGHPWCCAFVYWCFETAAAQLNLPNPMVKTGGCLEHWNRAKARSSALRIPAERASEDPSALGKGMVFIIDHGNSRGHTGFVEEVEGGWLSTIEGNTNASKSREGGGVYRLERKVAEINKGFIAYQM